MTVAQALVAFCITTGLLTVAPGLVFLSFGVKLARVRQQ
jgi:hypothetical protein